MNIFFMIGQCTQNAFENLEEFSFIFSAQKGTFLLTALPHISKTNLDLIFIWSLDEPDRDRIARAFGRIGSPDRPDVLCGAVTNYP